MGKVVSSIGRALGFGGGSSTNPALDQTKFDYSKQVQERVAPARDASIGLIKTMQDQIAGKSPSIAESQLRSTTNRNLAQTMAAAAASRGGNPAAMQRQLLQQRAASNRDVAEQGATLRLQEQQANQNMLANLTNQQQQNDLNQIIQPGQIAAGGEQARFNADVARVNRTRDQQDNILGSVLGGAGQLIAGGAGGLAKSLFSGGGSSGSTGGASPVQGNRRMVASPFAKGGLVDGPEIVKGDSEINDIVPAVVSPGEMVIPKSVVEQGHSAVSKFAKTLLKAKQSEKPIPKGYAAILAAKKAAKRGQ